MKYNPVIKNGLFEVSNGIQVKPFRAVDVAQAKFKFSKFAACAFNPSSLTAKVIEQTIRQNEF